VQRPRFLLNWGYFARFARNSRAVTALEAVRRRLGPVNEQTFTWLQLPFQILQAGIWLYGLGIFCTPVFGFDLHLTIVVCGVVVVFLSAAGGSWAVVAGDFIQALVLVPITMVAAFTALRLAGGLDAFVATLPETLGSLCVPPRDLDRGGSSPWCWKRFSTSMDCTVPLATCAP
jgi:SSS family solute:Na+ symporter